MFQEYFFVVVQTCVVKWSTLCLGIQLFECSYMWISHCLGRRGMTHGSTADEKKLLSCFKCFRSIKFVEDCKALLCQFSSLGFYRFISRISNSWQVCHREPSAGCQDTLLLFVCYKSCTRLLHFPSKEFPQYASLLRHLWLFLSPHPRWMLNGPLTPSLSAFCWLFYSWFS